MAVTHILQVQGVPFHTIVCPYACIDLALKVVVSLLYPWYAGSRILTRGAVDPSQGELGGATGCASEPSE